MKNKYQIEYEKSNGCFWKREPAKYVRLFVDNYCSDLQKKRVLDLGAGEGKNAVFLAAKGANVKAIDISPIALSRFNQQPNYSAGHMNIDTICDNISNLDFKDDSFDIIVAYGILHCLSSVLEVENYIHKLKKWIAPNGYFICVTFTDELLPPDSQSYLDYESFLKQGELEKLFANWKILEVENDVISEIHPTSNIEHQHSLVRLIAQKI
jgi:2-polyprenyl-3-methyl-5-hydroxy-6-metoxy-1,4-benzoquinol methylase